MSNDLAVAGHDSAIVDHNCARWVIHHGGGDGIRGHDDEFGGRADSEPGDTVVHDARSRPRTAVDDGATAARGEVCAGFDHLVLANTGTECELPCPLQHVAVSIGRPVIADPVLTQ